MSKLNKNLVLLVIGQVLFGLLGACVFQIIFADRLIKTMATINLTGLEDTFVSETAKLSISDVEKKQRVTKFAKLLSQVTKQISNEKNVVLVVSEAVVSGAPDMTNEVATRIKKRMSQ